MLLYQNWSQFQRWNKKKEISCRLTPRFLTVAQTLAVWRLQFRHCWWPASITPGCSTTTGCGATAAGQLYTVHVRFFLAFTNVLLEADALVTKPVGHLQTIYTIIDDEDQTDRNVNISYHTATFVMTHSFINIITGSKKTWVLLGSNY